MVLAVAVKVASGGDQHYDETSTLFRPSFLAL